MVLILLFFCNLHSILVSCDSTVFRNVRIQTLSPRVIRVENIGPLGFEDRTTFTVINRQWSGVPILSKNNSNNYEITVRTAYYSVTVSQIDEPNNVCFGQQNMDVINAVRSPFWPDGVSVSSAGDCCAKCQMDPDCHGWVLDTSLTFCYPLNAWSSTVPTSQRNFGCLGNGCYSVIQSITVRDPSGNVILSQPGVQTYTNLLQWPSPLSASTYVLTDFPRFYVPAWGPTPAQSDTPFPTTNGYDYTNNINGDFYIFILGSTLDNWFNARSDFVKLVGPTPVLPDFAYGTWFTYWYSYSETEAKSDIQHWKQGQLPLDVYGLDMNWRNTSNLQDHFYSHPDTALFQNFTEWFSYVHSNGLKTYFNDHPFPVDLQTSPSEVGFRYGGLSEWMERGLDYWWFDHNWSFSIPPPQVLPVGGWTNSYTDGNWLGLDNAAWGSHVYFESVKHYYLNKGDKVFQPMTLTKFARPDWRDDMPSAQHAEHPAHHRYPVWWTGDGVSLKASLQSMVDCGVHDFKPFVHSDCGGDYRGTSGDLMRWTAHCAFGTIHRFHGSDHRPWTYDANTQSVIQKYLNMRYKLIPSFIAAGQAAVYAGFPLVVRADVYWPQYGTDASSNLQYIHLNDTLVAPIWDSTNNMTTRSVWVPPGDWQDAWDGSVVTGPTTISVTKPYEQIPLWHRRGGLVVTVDSDAQRVADQDWSVLTLEAFPSLYSSEITRRSVYSLGSAARTDITMHCTSPSSRDESVGLVNIHISASEDAESRGWLVRLHLLPGQYCVSAAVDGYVPEVVHIEPHRVVDDDGVPSFFPFGGRDTAPAPRAGYVALIKVPSHDRERELVFKIEQR